MSDLSETIQARGNRAKKVLFKKENTLQSKILFLIKENHKWRQNNEFHRHPNIKGQYTVGQQHKES